MIGLRHIVPLANFAIIDGARVGEKLKTVIHRGMESQSLYRGMLDAQIEQAGPYLVRLVPGEDWRTSLLYRGWGLHWGICVTTGMASSDIYKHFRQFLIVKDETGRKLHFRFYDPRVLRVFLPTCSPGQLRDLFGPMDYFILEDAQPERAIIFSLEKGALRKDVVDVTKEDVDLSFLPKRKSIARKEQLIV